MSARPAPNGRAERAARPGRTERRELLPKLRSSFTERGYEQRTMMRRAWAAAGLGAWLATAALLSASMSGLPAPFGVLLFAGAGLGAVALLAQRRDPLADAG